MRYTLTLSRWHKVAERINAALKERETEVKAAFTATTISPWNKEGVEEKAAEIARRAADALELIEAGARAVAQIRAALSIRNAELGVSERSSCSSRHATTSTSRPPDCVWRRLFRCVAQTSSCRSRRLR
jgi:hypothetical protein